jgi:hypothetical protein
MRTGGNISPMAVDEEGSLASVFDRAPERVQVTAIPPDLPVDDLATQNVFALCVGKSFDVIGRNGELLELAVGEVMGVAPLMHSIWIEPQFTDAVFTSLRLSDKMLRFVIDAVEFRIAAFAEDIANPQSSEDAVADAGNDRMLLVSALAYLRERDAAQ